MTMDPITVGLLGIGLLLLLLALRIPVGFALLMAGFLGVFWVRGYSAASTVLSDFVLLRISSYSSTVVPLYVVLGFLAYETGLAELAFKAAYLWVGKVSGGLAIAGTGACALFGAVSGSSVAAAVAIGRMAVPELLRYGYDKRLATGVIAASGTLAILIPPSVILVVLAIITEQSIGKLLIGGILPGIVSALIYMIMIFIRTRFDPTLAPSSNLKITWRERFAIIPQLWGIALIFVFVVGGIYGGMATPTESAALAAAVAILLLIRRSKSWGETITKSKAAFWDASKTTAMVFTIVVGAQIFGSFLTISQFALSLTQFMTSLPLPPSLILFCALLIFLPLGMVLGAMGAALIVVPILWPVVMAFGFDPIWFCILVVKYCEVGTITPPVCITVYGVLSVSPPGITLNDIIRGTLWFLVMDMLTIIILFLFPVITTFLPNTMR